LNAANEVAVQAFLDETIRFDQIFDLNREALDAFDPPSAFDIESVMEADGWARQWCHQQIINLKNTD